MIVYLSLTAIFSITFILILFYLSKKYSSIVESPSEEIRKIHNKKMIKIGGIVLISYMVYLIPSYSNQLLLISFFGVAFLLLGLTADLNKNLTPKSRLIYLFILISCYLLLSKNFIHQIDSEIINNYILINPILIFFFSIACLALLINGVNLIDGLHGFKLATIIIIITIFIINIPIEQKYLLRFLYCLLVSCSILFLANFFTAKIKSGDAGSYFVAFLIGCIAIYINNLKLMNSFYIASILSFPMIEVTYSYFRRIYNKSNPFKPDNLHLHSILFEYIRNKASLLKKDDQNRLATIVLILYQIVAQFLIFIYAEKSLDYVFALIILIAIYIITRSLLMYFLIKN